MRIGVREVKALIAVLLAAQRGWTRDEALQEMDEFGFYRGWRDLRAYVEGLATRTHAVWPPPPGTFQ